MTEHEKAWNWRVAMGYSRRHVAEATGFSESLIADIESGTYRENGKPIADHTMQRYRLACGALSAGVQFDWFRINGRPVWEDAPCS